MTEGQIGTVFDPYGNHHYGLGMTLSKCLVESMGGTVGVNNTGFCTGREFWLCIPIIAANFANSTSFSNSDGNSSGTNGCTCYPLDPSYCALDSLVATTTAVQDINCTEVNIDDYTFPSHPDKQIKMRANLSAQYLPESNLELSPNRRENEIIQIKESPRILIVEDNPINQMLTRRMLGFVYINGCWNMVGGDVHGAIYSKNYATTLSGLVPLTTSEIWIL
eukprot:NODE_1787_length_1810_cov_33.159455_g1517_i0.p1 GENE.NODE_1787_length_1810_cov_33.159455_g1517_i0~~NODE_1787_length_1810_cov_33.159455_g1517_i0.p1  ORF type:complete len:221 (-),score=20.83 NODE_1787_length_1810_cov_33.159455_g1517_i0:844-1506(-)